MTYTLRININRPTFISTIDYHAEGSTRDLPNLAHNNYVILDSHRLEVWRLHSRTFLNIISTQLYK